MNAPFHMPFELVIAFAAEISIAAAFFVLARSLQNSFHSGWMAGLLCSGAVRLIDWAVS